MKKVVLIIVALLAAIAFAVISIVNSRYDNKVLSSLGESKGRVKYLDKSVEDSADYIKYFYDKDVMKMFDKNEYFLKVEEYNQQGVVEYFEDFENRVQKTDYLEKYDFNVDFITEGDYFYIDDASLYEDSTYKKHQSYEVYFFDSDTHILYHIRKNK